MPSQTDQEKLWAKIVSRAWADDNFKKRLLAEPKAILAESGIDLDKDIEYSVIEQREKQAILILPQKPTTDSSVESTEMRRSAWFFRP